MAKLSAYFVLFFLFSLILIRPGIHAVEARLLSKESRLRRNELRRLSSEEVEPAKSGPSPGDGHEFGQKRNVVVNTNSSPISGVGHGFDQKRNVVVNANSGPSPGAGHRFDRKDYGKRNLRSGPSPGDGNGIQNSKKTPIAVNNSGPSPGEGHKHDPAKSMDENK